MLISQRFKCWYASYFMGLLFVSIGSYWNDREFISLVTILFIFSLMQLPVFIGVVVPMKNLSHIKKFLIYLIFYILLFGLFLLLIGANFMDIQGVILFVLFSIGIIVASISTAVSSKVI
ncbi:hypothetical protein A5844_000344 [Enterococcus sp. 10A9_DIV0425]|uniref:Uncharacterized protein n=1 Tax=Candidatus Enterococcus wittei TaxID=1987383 RepID=A0A2C9XQJ2_9ENTE|nr:hypothetical protein A5844_000344 [Enterococcus sp. 10A9_DIV0425]